MTDVDSVPPSYRRLFANREYRAIFAADLVSLAGDQVSAVALAVLLYEASGSPLIAALGYATGFLPWVFGGPILAALIERFPPRRALVACDAARAILIGLAAQAGTPLWLVGVLVLCSSMLSPPFQAAASALYPQILTDDRYVLAVSLRDVVHQGAQLIGFAGGGALVALIGAHQALGLDAASFAISAAVLRFGLSARPPMNTNARPHLWHDVVEGWRLVSTDVRLYAPLLLGIVGAAYLVVPESIAVAYADQHHSGPGTVGLIMASVAAGSIFGSLIYGRFFSPARRQAWMWPLAMAGTVPLLVLFTDPPMPVALGLLTVAGLTGAFQVTANTNFALAAPSEARARAFGLAMTGMFAGQGLTIVAAGAAAEIWQVSQVIAGAGVVGAAAVLLLRGPVRRAMERSAAMQADQPMEGAG